MVADSLDGDDGDGESLATESAGFRGDSGAGIVSSGPAGRMVAISENCPSAVTCEVLASIMTDLRRPRGSLSSSSSLGILAESNGSANAAATAVGVVLPSSGTGDCSVVSAVGDSSLVKAE